MRLTAMRLTALRDIAPPAVAWPLLLLVIGTFLIVLPQTGYFHGIPGGFADSRFNSFILEHVYRWLRGMEPSLWSPGFFYPYADVLAFSDTHLGSVPIYAFFRLAGLDRYTAYAAWFTAGFLLNFISANACLKRLRFGPFAAAIGAFVFAFSMPALAQPNHTQLLYRCAIPPSILAAQRFLESRNPAYLGAMAAWAALQFYFAPYTGLFTMLLLVIWMLAGLALRLLGGDGLGRCFGAAKAIIHDTPRRNWVLAASGILPAFLALGYLLGKYWLVSRAFGLSRSYEGGSADMLPRLGSLLLADQSMFWGWLSRSIPLDRMRDEHQLFTGFGVWVLISIAVFRSRQVVVWTAGVALLSIFALTCSVGNHSFYWIVNEIPGFSAIRFAVRIWLVLLFPIAILVAAAVQSIDWRAFVAVRPSRLDLLGVLAAALLVVESIAVHSSFLRTDMILARIDHLRAMLPVPLTSDAVLFSASAPNFASNASEIDAMTVAQEAGIRTLNGYSGFWPPGYNFQLPKSCQEGAFMLSMFVARTGGDSSTFDRIAANVVPVGFDDCDPKTWTMLSPISGPLPDQVFDRLRLDVGPISDKVPRQLLVKVRIENRSGSVLQPMSLTDNGVLLSWRFVDAASGVPLSDWSLRFDLPVAIGAGQAETVDLPMFPPKKPGRYWLQVSMVQEHVGWLFNHGVAPALGEEMIVVSPKSLAVVPAPHSAP